MSARPAILVLMFGCSVVLGLTGAGSAEARARNGLIAFSQETRRCNDFTGCGSYVWTVNPTGRGRQKLPCSTDARRGCRDVVPVFSPAGNRLATATLGVDDFTEDLVSRDILAVRRVDGSVLRRIPETGRSVTALTWSADASRLGFATSRGIYIVARDGSGQSQFREVRVGDLSWSRQGRLAWVAPRGGRISVTDKARSRVRRLRVFAYSVAWSPTGRRLAYITTDETLKTVSANGRNRRTLTRRCTGPQTGFNFQSDVAWSPDGRQLLCSSLERGLLAVNVRTGRVRTVVRDNSSPITSFDWQKAPRR